MIIFDFLLSIFLLKVRFLLENEEFKEKEKNEIEILTIFDNCEKKIKNNEIYDQQMIGYFYMTRATNYWRDFKKNYVKAIENLEESKKYYIKMAQGNFKHSYVLWIDVLMAECFLKLGKLQEAKDFIKLPLLELHSNQQRINKAKEIHQLIENELLKEIQRNK